MKIVLSLNVRFHSFCLFYFAGLLLAQCDCSAHLFACRWTGMVQGGALLDRGDALRLHGSTIRDLADLFPHDGILGEEHSEFEVVLSTAIRG